MKIFVVFGSASDENVSTPLVKSLSPDFEVEFEVISAHRDHEKLQAKMASWRGDAVIAGAGLAAALPGVVAAMTPLPVFGVPVPAQFGGLDSLASIAQMPPGVPVITCGPDTTAEIVSFLKAYKNAPRPNAIHFVAPDAATLAHPDLAAEIAKAEKKGAEHGMKVTSGTEMAKDAFNAVIVTKPEHVKPGVFCIHMPFLPRSEAAKADSYLPVFALARKGGLWVGVNNTRNAVHTALRLRGA